jgi:hypothetical protein
MNIIDALREKYKDRSELLLKLDCILASLPATLQAAEDELAQRAARRAETNEKKESFMKYFFDMNPIYYVPASGTFVRYGDNHFTELSEDDLTHLIFKQLSVNRSLSKWKYKIKMTMVKRIRETHLNEAVPNTATCKSVVRSIQTVFGNKAYAKYFLVILGDILWGKRNQVYFVDESLKPFLHLVARDVSTVLNRNVLEDFKYKYAQHEFSKCRLLPGKAPDRLPVLNAYDVIAVAAFYLKKHESADAFLETCPDTDLKEKVLFLSKQTPAKLVEAFLGEYTTRGEGTPLKDVCFLWKTYLKEHKLPTVVNRVDFTHILADMGHYTEATEVCPGITPLTPPNQLNFAHFWAKHVTPDSTGWFEHSEILQLYNSWCESKSLRASLDEVRQWVEERVGEKVRVRCSLWNKEADLDNALEAFRLEGNKGAMRYEDYCVYAKRHRKMVVTRLFFQSYAK